MPLIDALRVFRLDGTVPTATIANWMRIAAGNTTRSEWYDGKGPLPQSAIERLMQEMGIGYWGLRFGLYGRERVVAQKLAGGRGGVLPHRGDRDDRRDHTSVAMRSLLSTARSPAFRASI